jgi:hypothetical protein
MGISAQIVKKLSAKKLNLRTITTKVGYLKSNSKVYENGESVTDVAAKNEFGVQGRQTWQGSRTGKTISVDGIPPRPFMRTSFNSSKDFMLKGMRKIIRSQLREPNSLEFVKDRMDLLGAKAVSEVQKTITDISEPPNSPQVVAEKRSSNPLIDTGLMRRSADFETELL